MYITFLESNSISIGNYVCSQEIPTRCQTGSLVSRLYRNCLCNLVS